MPRADNVPLLLGRDPQHPLHAQSTRAKGVGEVGAIGSPPAVINAVLDALSPLGVQDIAMPATPQKVWQALQNSTNRARGRMKDGRTERCTISLITVQAAGRRRKALRVKQAKPGS